MAEFVIVESDDTRYVHDVEKAAGRAIVTGPDTALGVFEGIKAAPEHVFGDGVLRGRNILWCKGSVR